MAHGFVYLVAVMDGYSRRVLSWRVSTSMESDFWVSALQEVPQRFGQPEMSSTDQGAQFTFEDFTDELLNCGVKVSLDGTGRCLDNVFVERLWRSLKYEEVCLCAHDTVPEVRKRIGEYFEFYNKQRFHAALGNQTPAAFYAGLVPAA